MLTPNKENSLTTPRSSLKFVFRDKLPIEIDLVSQVLIPLGMTEISIDTADPSIFNASFNEEKVLEEFKRKLESTHWLIINGRFVDLFEKRVEGATRTKQDHTPISNTLRRNVDIQNRDKTFKTYLLKPKENPFTT